MSKVDRAPAASAAPRCVVDGAALNAATGAVPVLSPQVADLLVDLLVVHLRAALLRGEEVVVPGLGRLESRTGKTRVLRHPISGLTIHLAGDRGIVFHPDPGLLRALNSGKSAPPA